MTLRIVPSFTPDGTAEAPMMPGDVELARTSLRCLQGGMEQAPKPLRRLKPNTASRLYQLRMRLFEEMASGNTLPIIDELMRIAEGDVDPEPEAA